MAGRARTPSYIRSSEPASCLARCVAGRVSPAAATPERGRPSVGRWRCVADSATRVAASRRDRRETRRNDSRRDSRTTDAPVDRRAPATRSAGSPPGGATAGRRGGRSCPEARRARCRERRASLDDADCRCAAEGTPEKQSRVLIISVNHAMGCIDQGPYARSTNSDVNGTIALMYR